ncbi:MAG: hypothetical protein QOJ98_59, partial [Acidobacteriota bacterium]|nr:hypothetical protein [Acidobacteriota bacterium]
MNEEAVLSALTRLQHSVSEVQQTLSESHQTLSDEITTLRRDTMSHFDAV